MASNFYNDLLEHDFYEEKTASEHSNTEAILNTLSADQIEAIAEELGLLFEKEAGEETVESKVEDQNDKKEQEDKKDDASQAKSEGATSEKDERDQVKSEGAEQAKAEAVKEEIAQPKAEEVKEEVKEAAEVSEEEIMKVAYAIAEEKLASAGVSVADYIFGKIANEDISLFIADKAEKLAYVSEKSAYQVADDILGEMGNILGESEE